MKSPRFFYVLCILLLLTNATAFAFTTRTAGSTGDFPTIQAAINASSALDIVSLLAGNTFTEAVNVDRDITLIGVDTSAKINGSITVNSNGVTIQNLVVYGSAGNGISATGRSGLTLTDVVSRNNTGSGAQLTTCTSVSITGGSYSGNLDEGINAVNGSGYTTSGVTASDNGTGANGSGFNLKNVTGPSTLTNTTANSNHVHGLSVGDGSTSVTIDGGTFNGNGQSGNGATGGGINIVAQGGTTTTSVTVKGTVTASNNMAAGVYVYAASNTDNLSTINIGDGTNTITASNNGSGGGTPGGAGVVVVGKVTDAHISKVNFTKGAAPGAGVMQLKNGSSNSPTGTTVANCTFASDYDATHPVATLDDNQGHASVNNVTATTGNTITGVTTGFATEDLIVHKLDNAALGLVTIDATNLFVTASSGSIQRGIDAATAQTVNVGAGTYAESVTLNKAITLAGVDTSAKIKPSAGNGITITSNGATVQTIVIWGAPGNGISATGRTGLTFAGVVSRNNTGSGAQLTNCSTVGVTASSFSGNLDEGFNASGGGSSYTMNGVVASNNGNTTPNGSGINLKGVTGTSTLTNLTVANNHFHGLSVGNGASGITIDGGSYTGNGTSGDATTGAGINIAEQLGTGATTSGVALQGNVNSSDNTSAGVYVYAAGASDNITTVTIGDNTNAITLSNNGSGGGGAGVVVAGNAVGTQIRKVVFTKGAATPRAAILNLGTDNIGTNSPTGTSVTNSTFNDYTSASPAVSLTDGSGHTSIIDVSATTNTFKFPVAAKVFLQGPYSGGTMGTALRVLGDFPLTQPYASYAGTENVASVPANVVDWLLLDLRSTFNGAAVSQRAAFLLNDGTVVDLDGTSKTSFTEALASGYTISNFIVVRHRNHLAVMSAAAVGLPNEAATYDFSTAQTQAYGATPMADLGGGTAFGMIAGDVTGNGQVKYNGPSNDRLPIFTRIGGVSLSATLTGYYPEDVNLNGQVKYNGPSNDRLIIFTNIGGVSFSATVSTQVP